MIAAFALWQEEWIQYSLWCPLVLLSLEASPWLYHSIIKLPSLQPILMVTPGRGWTAAVRIQQDSEVSRSRKRRNTSTRPTRSVLHSEGRDTMTPGMIAHNLTTMPCSSSLSQQPQILFVEVPFWWAEGQTELRPAVVVHMKRVHESHFLHNGINSTIQ